MMAAVTTPSSVILDCLIALSFDLVTEVRRRRPERDHLALLLVVRSLGIERALQSAMVATEAANLSIIWADDRTALGYSQLAARTTRSSKAARARRRQHSYLPVDTRSLMVSLLSRFAPRAGLVTLRQTFVRRSHGDPAGRSMMSNGTSSAPEFEDLASIPMAGGGLSRLAIARLKKAGVLMEPLLRRAGLTTEAVAEPEQRLSVRSQIVLLDEAAIALKDDCIGFTLARDFDPRELGLLYYVMASS